MGNATEVGWAPGPDGRGTLKIIWTCLSTLFLCLWASWHPDIPKNNVKKRERAWIQPLNKLGWVLLLLILPEAGMSISVYQAIIANRCAKALRKKGHTEWKFQHCIFAEMGGIELVQKDSSTAAKNGAADPESQDLQKVRCSGLLYLQETNLLPQEPPISDIEIRQHSKSDFIVKAIALVQVIWFFVSSTARTAQGLPVAQLEVVCLAYVFYGIVVYVAWWHKPLDISLVVQLQLADVQDADSRSIALPHDEDTGTSTSYYGVFDSILPDDLFEWKTAILIVLFAIFGGIHCAAWDSSFNSVAENMLWRVSSILLIAWYPSFMLTSYVFIKADISDLWSGLTDLSMVFVYAAARLYILVEAFLILRRSPLALYETVDWIKFLPHIN